MQSGTVWQKPHAREDWNKAAQRMKGRFQKVNLSVESLAGIDLLRGFSREERAQVLKYCEGRRYAAGQEIIRHKDTTTDVYLILSGRVQVTLFSGTGRVITFQDLREGHMFGELSAIDGKPRTASVFAVIDSTAVRIAGPGFLELFWKYPKIGERTLHRLSSQVRFLCERVVEFHALPIADRIRAELLRLAQLHPGDGVSVTIEPRPTHADIASRVGTHREAVTRELRELKQCGLATWGEAKIEIHDVPRLEHMVHEALGEPL